MSGRSESVFDLPRNSLRNASISAPSFDTPSLNSVRTPSGIFTPGGGTGRTFSEILSAGPSANTTNPQTVRISERKLRIGVGKSGAEIRFRFKIGDLGLVLGKYFCRACQAASWLAHIL